MEPSLWLVAMIAAAALGMFAAYKNAGEEAASSATGAPSLYSAKFKPDGTIDREGPLPVDTASPECMKLHELLRPGEGGTLKSHGPGKFSSIYAQITTSAAGTAIATIKLRELPAATGVYVSGQGADADAWMLNTFRESMLKVDIVSQLTRTGIEPFERLATITGRPLAAWLIWPIKVSEEEQLLLEDFMTMIGQAMYFRPGQEAALK